MKRKRVHLCKKTETYVLCMAKILEINGASLESVVTNLQMDMRQLQAKYLARKKNLHFALNLKTWKELLIDCLGLLHSGL